MLQVLPAKDSVEEVAASPDVLVESTVEAEEVTPSTVLLSLMAEVFAKRLDLMLRSENSPLPFIPVEAGKKVNDISSPGNNSANTTINGVALILYRVIIT